ncbi:MAG: TonB-dependent receptor, partial [Gemmatimonadota bacterium]|nr:TonB-dependent receptor [Gemmatimonadota bacterium]
MRLSVLVVAFAAASASPGALAAQRAAQRADTARVDSARTLGQVRVTVTRTEQAAERAPWAVDVIGRDAITRAQATVGIDEALNNVPGVIVSNRYNASVDQRLSIRGAGARANFGIRGVKILLDGVPQSLPDGQNQLTNVDLADVSRVEVLRGSASSLYGNGSGGVIAFETDRSAPDPFSATARVTGGSFGLSKVQGRAAGRTDRATTSLSVSRTRNVGFRMYDTSEARQAMGTLDFALAPGRTLEVRANYAESPVARNPGALTAAEYAKNPDSASATNIARGANKALSQSQFSARLHGSGSGRDWSLVGYVQRRFVDNPLATSPPGAPSGAAGAAIGTLSTLNRWVTGGRADASWRATVAGRPVTFNAGGDVERSFDIRRNRRVTGGVPKTAADTVFLDQGESVVAVGPFVSSQVSPLEPLTISAGVRQDWVTFRATDNFLADGTNNSGQRTMSALSHHLGASWVFSPALSAYANVAFAFETPTTTELSARPGGLGGFNPDLGPQRIHTVEGGVRGDFASGRVRYTLTAYEATYADAITQYLETNGRAYFRNAGSTRNRGVEAGLTASVASWLDASLAWTESRYRFTRYLAPRTATVTDTLDGKRVAGVPDRFVRSALRARRGTWSLDVEHTWSGAIYGDDRNSVLVQSWGWGVMNVRAGWDGTVGGVRVSPFA